jgi:short subunit dehydrogenase-like uncharacterized protein
MTAPASPDSPLVGRFVASPNYGERRGDGRPNCLILHYTGMPTGEPALRRCGVSHRRQSIVEARLLNGTILIYGAIVYTGKLIAKAASGGLIRPILAGRSLDKVRSVAEPLSLTGRAFDLGDPAAVDAAIKDVSVVLCVAGPFSATSRPMVEACLRNRVHYLDITGEIDVFEALAARHAEAKARGVMLLPGVGFDVAPSDCLAARPTA